MVKEIEVKDLEVLQKIFKEVLKEYPEVNFIIYPKRKK